MDGESSSVVGVVGEILGLTSGSGEELAAQVGVSYASLYAWSRGRRRPTARNARALADVARQRAKRLSELADTLVGLELDKGADEASPSPSELSPLTPTPELPASAVPPPRPD
jgi:transcriptional regulator with XRE-family HTH domain